MALQKISGAIAGIKTAIDILKTISDNIKDRSLNDKILELQRVIKSLNSELLVIQQDYRDLLNVKEQFHRQLIEYKTWEEEKSNYQLEEPYPGIMVYSYKKEQHSVEPNHWLCTNCYSDSKKSIIQLKKTAKSGREYFCPRCKMQLEIPHPFRPGTVFIGKVE